MRRAQSMSEYIALFDADAAFWGYDQIANAYERHVKEELGVEDLSWDRAAYADVVFERRVELLGRVLNGTFAAMMALAGMVLLVGYDLLEGGHGINILLIPFGAFIGAAAGLLFWYAAAFVAEQILRHRGHERFASVWRSLARL